MDYKSKADLREKSIGFISQIENKAHKSEQLISALREFAGETHTIASFRPKNTEPDVDIFHQNQWARFCFPVVNGTALVFRRAQSEKAFVSGKFNILQPEESKTDLIDLNTCPMVFVPGLFFDRRGARLGHGHGYYDRALANYKGKKVGICFREQILNSELPHEGHDVKMDYIITEDFIYEPKY